jgi:methyl-accepting chemotaxis protein
MRSRLALLVAIFVVGFIAFGVFSYNTLRIVRVNGPLYAGIVQGKDLIADILPPPEYVIESYLLVLQMAGETDHAELESLVRRSNGLRAEYERRHEFWVGDLPEGSLREMMVATSYEPAREFFEIRDREFIPAMLRGDRQRAGVIAATALKEKYEQHRRAIDGVVKMATERNAADEQRAAEIVRTRTVAFVTLGFGIVGLALFASWFIARGIRELVTHVRGTAVSVASASQQLAAAAEHLSSGSQQQASSLEETAASLEQITGTVKQSSTHARQVKQLAVDSQQTAVKGGEVVSSAVASMGEIATASKRIAEIIAVVDEIAFQTNLLALNAAVEAARAGEHGRGFTVVAAEVRNLAQRSSMAAKEIKTLIRESVQKVESGSELVNRSGATLLDIVASAKQVTEVIAEIAAAAQEQASGIEQVNRAVTQMDQVVQTTAAETEELSATAQSLAGQAGELQVLLARFDLAGEPPAASMGVRQPGVTAGKLRPAGVADRSKADGHGGRRSWEGPDGAAEF